MKKWVIRHKKVGETPLEVVEAYRHETQLSKETSIAYAGRLDPMADGKLLILIGDECKHQEKYHDLDKTYRFGILFGFSSDTGDVLGMATHDTNITKIDKERVTSVLKTFIGKNEFPYPLFSSKTVQGKPLHTWTLEGRLNEIEIPTKTSTVYSLKLESLENIEKETLQKQIFKKIDSVPEVVDPRKALGADFRRKDIRARWHSLFTASEHKTYCVATVLCEASSGTYMRTLAEEIGKRLGVKSLAYGITRTKIGKRANTLFGGIWYKNFK